MNRKFKLLLSMYARLEKCLDESLTIFWASRPMLYESFSVTDRKYLSTIKKTEDERLKEEIAICEEIENCLSN